MYRTTDAWRRQARACRARFTHVLQACFATALLLTAGLTASAGTVQYVYNADGKLTTVISPSGIGTHYIYDAAGNIKSIDRHAVGSLWIGEFSPTAGGTGTAVTIYGGGFSTTPADNVVKFNGTQAVVSSATANRLTVKVPDGATSGPISVTVGGNTATSAAPYTVGFLGYAAPAITGFTPTQGVAGTVVTINGKRFSAERANNMVQLNGRAMQVDSATTSALQIRIAAGATAGRFTVKTPQGSATSSDDFYVAPAGVNSADIARRLRVVVDGAPLQIAGLPGGKVAQIVFDGTAGQRLGLGVSAFGSAPAGGTITPQILTPSGATLTSDCGSFPGYNGGGACDLKLPASGTYQLLLTAATGYDVSFALTLSKDLGGTLTTGDTGLMFDSARYGQNARYTFTAEAGKVYSISAGDSTIASPWSYLYVYTPGGAEVAQLSFAAGYGTRLTSFTAPVSGSYTVFVDPYPGSIGRVKLVLTESTTSTIGVNGPARQLNLAAGQTAIYTFNGTAGKAMGLGVDAYSTTPAGGSVAIGMYGPSGAEVGQCGWSGSISSSDECDFPPLPDTGTYTLKVVSDGKASASMSLTLSTDVTGRLVPNAPAPTTIATTRSGQNARYAFAGTVGQNYSIAVQQITYAGTWSYLRVYAPDGTELLSRSVDAGSNLATLDIKNAPATGDYTLFVDPAPGATGQAVVALRDTAIGTLAVDGTASQLQLLEGQNGRYSFTGTAGQWLGLGITNVASVPAGARVVTQIFGPTGALLIDCGTVDAAGECDLPALPADGNYIVQVDPSMSSTTALLLTLSNDKRGELSLDAATPTVFTTTRNGQNGRYSFDGVAGQSYSIVFPEFTIPGLSTTITVYDPTGNKVSSGTGSQTNGFKTMDLVNVPASGRYAVVIDPYSGNTGRVKLALRSLANGLLAIDGTPTSVHLLTGQNGRYTFDGSAGQRLGLGVSGLATQPAGYSVAYRVLSPIGATLVDCYSTSGASDCDLPPLPASGSYAVQVDPEGGVSSDLALTLSNDVAGALTANAPTPRTVTIKRIGQNARLTFTASAGTSYSIALSDSSYAAVRVAVYAPDGSRLVYKDFAPGDAAVTLELPTVMASGEYAVFVDPAADATGQLKLALRSAADGTLAVDGTPTAVNLLGGQNGRYTFSGTAGQRLGLGMTSISTTPAGGFVWFVLRGPTGAQIADCSYATLEGDCKFPPLPANGVYTLHVDPDSNASASMTLTLSTEATGTLTVNAPSPVTFNAVRAGQNGRYTYTGQAGKNYSIDVSDVTIPGLWTTISVLAPDGTMLRSGYGAAGQGGTSLTISNVAATGEYTVFVDPFQAATGQVKLKVVQTGTTDPTPQEPNGSIVVNGASQAFDVPATKTHLYTFQGTAGQRLGLGITGLVTSPASGWLRTYVKRIDNASVLIDCSYDTHCTIPPLPATGTYTVALEPYTGYSARGTVTLSTDAGGALTANAATPTTFATSRPGQRGRYTFAGQSGKSYSITAAGATFPGAASYVYVYAPDGKQLAYTWASISSNGPPAELPNVAATGTYSVVVVPNEAGIGQINIALRATATGTLAVNGDATQAVLLSGQHGSYSFTGTAGQSLGLGISALSTVPAGKGVTLNLYAPNGALLRNCDWTKGDADCDFPPLPANGSYRVEVAPDEGASANLTLTLSTDLKGPLQINTDTPRQFQTTRPGQDGRYTYTGVAGKRYSIAFTDSTFAGVATVLGPDGAYVHDTSLSSGSSKALVLPALKASGTHTVWLDATSGRPGQVKLALRETATAPIDVDGTPLPIALLSAQSGRYTFNGAAGQSLGLGFSDVTTTGDSVAFQVLTPTGAVLADCGGIKAANDCNLPLLPMTGAYVIAADTDTVDASTMTLTLSQAIVGNLQVNADAPTTFSTARRGQDGRYSFTAQAGQRYSLRISDTTIPGQWSYVHVYDPSGTEIGSSYTGATAGVMTIDLPPSVAGGRHVVHVDPYMGGTGDAKLALRRSANGTLAIDGTPTVATLLDGQYGRYSFRGSIGQRLGLGITAVSTSPLGGNVAVHVYQPNGSQLVDCNTVASIGECVLPALPATGTYVVEVDSGNGNAATATLTLSNDMTGSIAPNAAAPTAFANTRVGQNASYSVDLATGNRLVLAWTDATLAGATNYIKVYRPDGTQFGSVSFGANTPAYYWDFGTVDATGSYRVMVDPTGGNVGQVQLYASTALIGTLTVDAPDTAVDLVLGRMAEYTFNATAGQHLGAIVGDLVTAPTAPHSNGPLKMYVYGPTGKALDVYGCTIGSPQSTCQFPTITDSGTHKLRIEPGANSASFKLRIRSTL